VRYVDRLRGCTVTADEVPSLIDEVPVLALVAACAQGVTRFEGVSELRVKESDRLAAVANGLSELGVHVRSGTDWLEVAGPSALCGARLDSLGDHRLAMTWALAGMVASGPVVIEHFDAVDVSYPGFSDDISSLVE
jgi:3-phosphoshikimate 1-carboxyvinyltransferase